MKYPIIKPTLVKYILTELNATDTKKDEDTLHMWKVILKLMFMLLMTPKNLMNFPTMELKMEIV